MSLDALEDEWFTITRAATGTSMEYRTLRRAVRSGELETEEVAILHSVIRRNGLNRFLRCHLCILKKNGKMSSQGSRLRIRQWRR
jgi:hypothetical protein